MLLKKYYNSLNGESKLGYNGSGTFSINSTGQPVVSGTTISDTVHNALTADLATGLTNCITRDGQSPATANIPLGGNKITGLASGTAATDAATLAQVQSSAAQFFTAGGTADVITGTLSPVIGAYAAGQTFRFVASGANTGAVTLNLNSLGAKSVTKTGTTALASGDIPSGALVEVVYDGTQFQLINVKAGTPSGSITSSGYTQATSRLLGRTTASTGAIEEISVGSGLTFSGGSLTGKLGQIVTSQLGTVATGTTVIPDDNTIPQNTEGDQYLSLSITPSNASSTLEIDVSLQVCPGTAAAYAIVALFQDSTANALAAVKTISTAGTTGIAEVTFKHVMTAGTTSATTFKVRAGQTLAGTLTINGIASTQYLGGVMASRITIKEILP
jgi:hypothetical protein